MRGSGAAIAGASGGTVKVWRVDTGASRKNFGKATLLGAALLALGPVAVIALDVDLVAFQSFMRSFGFLVIMGFLALCYLPFLFRKKDPGFLRLQDGVLGFEDSAGEKALPLHDAQLSFARVSVHGTFLGTLFTVRSPHTGETMQLFGAGAELPPSAYDAGETAYPSAAWTLDRGSFGELVDALGGQRPPARSAASESRQTSPGAASPLESSAATPQETVFEATAPSSLAFGMIGMSFLPFLLIGGAVAATKVSWSTQPLLGLGILAVIGLLAVGPAYLLLRAFRQRQHGRVFLRFSPAGLVLEGAKGEIFRADVLPEPVLFTWRNHWIHQRRYTLGSAVRLTNVRGETVTLGIQGGSAILHGAPTTSRVDFILSPDAGHALLAELRSR